LEDRAGEGMGQREEERKERKGVWKEKERNWNGKGSMGREYMLILFYFSLQQDVQ